MIRQLPSITFFLLILGLCFSFVAVAHGDDADLALMGGKITTMNPAQPRATALACKDGKIIAVGSDDEIREHIGDATEVVVLNGRLAIPGFIESHGHFSGMGVAKMNLELREDTSWASIVAKVEAAANSTPAGQWITGRGWHQEKWTTPLEQDVEGYPLHDQLSAVSPNHPVFLKHASGHMAIANAAAMKLAGITAATKDPSGGEILRDDNGNPTGVLRETAQSLVSRLRQRDADSDETWRRAIALAAQECLENGVTSFQDAGSTFREIDLYRQAAQDGDLPVRMWVMVRDDPGLMQRKLKDYKIINEGDGFLTVRAVKQAIDGALGAHGAWLLEPYEDLNSSTGLNTMSLDVLKDVAELAATEDFQLCVHAIGDRANHEVLNLYEESFEKHPTKTSRRWRIEHAQHLQPSDIPRFGELGVIAAMQAIHCTSDAVFVGLRLGQRRAKSGAYMWRDLLDSGAIICNGTDAPVEDISAIASFHASVTRLTDSGTAFYGEQAMTREEALRSYTLHAAYAAFEDEFKGSLEAGKWADIVVLSNDIMTCGEEELLQTKVELTIVDGQIRFRR